MYKHSRFTTFQFQSAGGTAISDWKHKIRSSLDLLQYYNSNIKRSLTYQSHTNIYMFVCLPPPVVTASMWMPSSQWPAVTLIFDLQHLIGSSVGASEYSL